MKAGYEVGEQITVLSRQNQWRQCIVQAKRPGQLLVRCAAESGPALGAEGEREEWLSAASRRIRDYWDGKYLDPPSPSARAPAPAPAPAPAAPAPSLLVSAAGGGAPQQAQGQGQGQGDLLAMFGAPSAGTM